MRKVKVTASMVLLLVVVLFTLQNTEEVTIRFLLWHVSLSRALMIFLVFCLGLLAGLFLAGGGVSRDKEKPAKAVAGHEPVNKEVSD